MSYKDTYVIFNEENDLWAYEKMKGYVTNDKIDFSFYDAHDIKSLVQTESEESIKKQVGKRLAKASQAIVIIGDNDKNFSQFFRWEIEVVLKRDLPIIAINLNNKRRIDNDRCPSILKDKYVVHVPLEMKIIKYALENFPEEYFASASHLEGPRYYNDDIYHQLGLSPSKSS